MGTRTVIAILLVLVAALGAAVAYAISALVRMKKAVRRVDLETHLLSEKMDYLRRELEKLDPERYAPKTDWTAAPGPLSAAGTSPWAPGGANTAALVIDPALLRDAPPFLDERPESANEPPVRVPTFRPVETPAVDAPVPSPPRRSEILPDLKPLVELLPENMLEPDEEEPSVLPGSTDPNPVHATAGGSSSLRMPHIPAWLAEPFIEIRTSLVPVWNWLRVTSGSEAGGNYDAVALVWCIRGAIVVLGGALAGLMLYLVPSMEPEYVTVLGCATGIVCLLLAVSLVERGFGSLGRLLAIGGLFVTARSMCHAAWVSGVVPTGWAIAIVSIGAVAATMAGERNNSLMLAGAGIATAFVVPELMILHGVSIRFAAGLCVLLAAVVHAVASLRPWPLVRILCFVYGYSFLAYCVFHVPALGGISLGVSLVCLFATQHVLVLLGPSPLPRAIGVGSFWLGVLAMFLCLIVELGGMFQFFEHLQTLVMMFVLMLGGIALLERYGNPDRRDGPTGIALAACLVAMSAKLVLDLMPWHPGRGLVFNSPYSLYDAAVRCLDLIMVVAAFWMSGRRLTESAPRASVALGGFAFALMFVYATFEMNTYLHVNQPGFQGAGLSLLWGLVGVLLTMAGVSGKRPILSQLGGLFLIVMVVKLLAMDMGHMVMLHRVVALSGVGVLLLAGAVPYFRRSATLPDNSAVIPTADTIHQEPDPGHAP